MDPMTFCFSNEHGDKSRPSGEISTSDATTSVATNEDELSFPEDLQEGDGTPAVPAQAPQCFTSPAPQLSTGVNAGGPATAAYPFYGAAAPASGYYWPFNSAFHHPHAFKYYHQTYQPQPAVAAAAVPAEPSAFGPRKYHKFRLDRFRLQLTTSKVTVYCSRTFSIFPCFRI